MDVVIIGITGRIGRLLMQELLSKGDTVRGLVRRDEQQEELAARGVNAVVGDLTTVSVEASAAAFGNVESTVFSAGAEGDSMEVTGAMGAGTRNVIEATRQAGNRS